MAKRTNSESYVYRAQGTGREGEEHSPPPNRRPPVWLWVVLGIAAAALIGGLLWVFLLRPDAPEPVSSLPIVEVSVPLPLPEPEPEPAPEPVPEPEPEPDPVPEFAFTEDEIAMLNGMLSAWAAQGSTLPPSEEEATPEEEEKGPYGQNVSVYFCDITSGLTYVYNGGTKYLIASLNKAPYAVYLYTLVEQDVASLDETFYVTPDMLASVAENTGRMKEDETLPRDYTMDELIYEMLRYSDTGALKILLGRYGAEGYREWADTLGLVYPEDIRNVTNARITAEDAGVYLQEIFRYMEQGTYGAALQEHLLNTRNAMIRSEHPVARKYGWDVSSYHDMAVVYAPHPYLLAVLTDKSEGSYTETAMFAQITATFEGLLEAKYQEWEAALAQPG